MKGVILFDLSLMNRGIVHTVRRLQGTKKIVKIETFESVLWKTLKTKQSLKNLSKEVSGKINKELRFGAA